MAGNHLNYRHCPFLRTPDAEGLGQNVTLPPTGLTDGLPALGHRPANGDQCGLIVRGASSRRSRCVDELIGSNRPLEVGDAVDGVCDSDALKFQEPGLA